MNLAVVEKIEKRSRFWETLHIKTEVFIEIWIENKELNYMVSFKGTGFEILTRAKEIVIGMTKVLGDCGFKVRIEDLELTQSFFVDEIYIYDADFNPLFKTNEILDNALYRK